MCVAFNTFYGRVEYNNTYKNEDGYGVIIQMIKDDKGISKPKIVYPIEYRECQIECSENDKTCPCKAVYPATWVWKRGYDVVEINFEKTGYIILFSYIVFCILINYAVLIYKRKLKKKFNDIPRIDNAIYVSYICYAIAYAVLYTSPSTFICNITPFFTTYSVVVTILATYYITIINQSKNLGMEINEKDVIKEFLYTDAIFVLILLCILFTKPAESRVREYYIGETPYSYSYCWDNYAPSVLFPIIFLSACYVIYLSIILGYSYKSYVLIYKNVPLIIFHVCGYFWTLIVRTYINAEDRNYIPMIIYNVSVGLINVMFPIVYV